MSWVEIVWQRMKGTAGFWISFYNEQYTLRLLQYTNLQFYEDPWIWLNAIWGQHAEILLSPNLNLQSSSPVDLPLKVPMYVICDRTVDTFLALVVETSDTAMEPYYG